LGHSLIDSDRICVLFCFYRFFLVFNALLGEKGSCCFFVLGIHLLIQLCSAYAWGPEGFSILFSLPPLLVSVILSRANTCAVFLGFLCACVKRRSSLVFSYCIVGCSFGSILEIVETFIISYSFFTWNPPPRPLTHPFVCHASFISSAHLFLSYLPLPYCTCTICSQ